MKNRVESRGRGIAELFAPIQGGEILRDEIAAVAAQIFKIAGAKIVDHGEARVGKLVLQGKSQVRADKAGSAGDEKAGRRIRSSHGGNYSAANQICLERARAKE